MLMRDGAFITNSLFTKKKKKNSNIKEIKAEEKDVQKRKKKQVFSHKNLQISWMMMQISAKVDALRCVRYVCVCVSTKKTTEKTRPTSSFEFNFDSSLASQFRTFHFVFGPRTRWAR